MRNQPEFMQQQYAFAAHIRNPEQVDAPANIEDRRMAIYRELFYNNIENFLSANFPVLRKITQDENWHAMVRDFFIKHRCSTPHFPEIAQEFIAYLNDERAPSNKDFPFMAELAHYEWVELALTISDADQHAQAHDPNGDMLSGQPMISPLAWNLSYHYPVHKISTDFLPLETTGDLTHLVVYRDRLDEIHFLEINAVTQRLLQLIRENPQASGLEILEMIVDELQHPQPETVIAAGVNLVSDLKQRNILIGAKQ